MSGLCEAEETDVFLAGIDVLQGTCGHPECGAGDGQPCASGLRIHGWMENGARWGAMKICKKRGKRGADRKVFTARLPFEHYMKLCELAGTRSLSEALRELLDRAEKKITS